MKSDDKAKLAAALGASRTVEVGHRHLGGPLDMFALRHELNQRLQSSGGRPTDPTWKISRQVPFREDSWAHLQRIASDVGAAGRRVGPAQVAALLIESNLDEMDAAQWDRALDESRTLALVSQPDAADAAGTTYNQFDEWVQRGWLLPASRAGRQRSFGADEIVRAVWLRMIAQTRSDVNELAPGVRAADLGNRYLVVTTGATVRTVATRAELYRLLETPGGHLVVDQFPERRKLLDLSPSPDDAHDTEPISRAV